MRKEYRVRKNEEFADIMKHKRYLTSHAFVLYFKKKKENNARIGISVSKKLGNAVVRNKIKRQVRMMVQQMYHFQEDFDTIIIVRIKYKEENYENNKKDLERLYKKVRI